MWNLFRSVYRPLNSALHKFKQGFEYLRDKTPKDKAAVELLYFNLASIWQTYFWVECF